MVSMFMNDNDLSDRNSAALNLVFNPMLRNQVHNAVMYPNNLIVQIVQSMRWHSNWLRSRGASLLEY